MKPFFLYVPSILSVRFTTIRLAHKQKSQLALAFLFLTSFSSSA
jgi:hypothetical protein